MFELQELQVDSACCIAVFARWKHQLRSVKIVNFEGGHCVSLELRGSFVSDLVFLYLAWGDILQLRTACGERVKNTDTYEESETELLVYISVQASLFPEGLGIT